MTGLVALSWITETIAPVRWGATFPLLGSSQASKSEAASFYPEKDVH